MLKKSLLVSVLTITLILSACAAPANVTPAVETNPEESAAFTLVDALGREVTFEQPPSRIILPGRALFMVADALYLFPKVSERIIVMGETQQGSENFIALIDPDYSEKALLNVDAGAEQVAAYQPDAVILKSFLAQSLGSGIEALGIPVVYIDFETPEQYQRDLQILGMVLQDKARAAQVAALYQTRLEAVTAITTDIPEDTKPRVLLLYYSDKDGSVAFNVPPMSWIQTQMVEMAGGIPVWTDASLGKGWTTVTLEQIAAWDADYIFIVSYFRNPVEVVEELKQDENWALLRAAREEDLYAFASDFFSWDQPDTRWILGLQWLATKLHPEHFTALNIVEEARDFYQDYYGLDTAFIEENILPLFKGVLP